MTDLVGKTIGAYQIVERLGRGGMADVYKAYHPDLAQHRAIKIIRPELVTEAGFQERFRREAQAAAALRHPNIVQIHDFGVQDDLYYMVMEYIDGHDLKDLLQREGPIRPFRRIAEIIKPIAAALQYAHERGVVHRDVKPANVLITNDNHIILADFGVAKMLDHPAGEQLTGTGMAMGTPSYMAPEQAEARSVGPAADVYSLGIILYEMLTGTVPFNADTPLAVLLKVMTEPLPAPRLLSPDVPDLVQGVVLKATQKDPQRRYATAAAMVTALEQSVGLRAGTPEIVPSEEDDATTLMPTVSDLKAQEAGPTFVMPTLTKQRPSRLGWYAGGAVLALLVMALSAFWLLRSQPSAATWQFIVDASGSMNETIGDQAKIEIARAALADELRILPDNVAAGLRIFGGQLSDGNGCLDTVQLLAPAQEQGEQLISELARVAPAGEAPLTEAIVQAVGDFDLTSSGRHTLIIITDGVDTCEQDAIGHLTTLTRRLGINLDLHLVGLGVTNSTAREELSALAVAVDGRYYEANSAAEIKEVIAQQASLLTGTPAPTPTAVTATVPTDAITVEFNTPTTVELDASQQSATYVFEGVAEQTIFLDEQGIESEQFSSAEFNIIGPAGILLSSKRGTSVNSADIGPLTLPQTGSYLLEITPLEEYALQAMFTIWELDPPVKENGAVPFEQLINGQLDTPGQTATYTFTGRENQTIFFDEQGIEQLITSTILFTIKRPNGLPLSETNGSSVNSADMGPLTLPEDGEYTLTIDPLYDNIPSFAFFLWDVEVPIIEERQISFGEVVEVQFSEPGQTAVYTFEAEEGETFHYEDLGITAEKTTRIDFAVTAPNGLTAAESYGSTVNRVNLGDMTAVASGRYTLTIDPTYDNSPTVTFAIQRGSAN